MFRIMIVEDDEKIAQIVADDLTRFGYDVATTREFGRVKAEFERISPDLLLLDVNLPQYDGFYWCRQIRTVSTLPVIFVSARTGELDQVLAIEHGGDDYVQKPFSLELLRAKIRSALRRAYGEYAARSEQPADVWQIAGLRLDDGRNSVSWQEQQAEFPATEYRLLRCLARRAGQIVPREDLLAALWDDVSFVDDNTLTVNVTRVRKRLEDLGLGNAVETKRGQGYLLRLPAGEA